MRGRNKIRGILQIRIRGILRKRNEVYHKKRFEVYSKSGVEYTPKRFEVYHKRETRHTTEKKRIRAAHLRRVRSQNLGLRDAQLLHQVEQAHHAPLGQEVRWRVQKLPNRRELYAFALLVHERGGSIFGLLQHAQGRPQHTRVRALVARTPFLRVRRQLPIRHLWPKCNLECGLSVT